MQDFYAFQLGRIDVVLGYECLAGLGKIRAYFGEHVMWIKEHGKN